MNWKLVLKAPLVIILVLGVISGLFTGEYFSSVLLAFLMLFYYLGSRNKELKGGLENAKIRR